MDPHHSIKTADGTRLHLRHWPHAGPRGTVLIVHGLGEHIGRYEHVAEWLGARDFAALGYDHRGHGRSDGRRGVIPRRRTLENDLCFVAEELRPQRGPLIVLAHSLGGGVAAGAVARGRLTPDALVLSSPALAARLSPVQRLQLWFGLRVAPGLAQPNGLDPQKIAHDPATVRAYIDDPLVHDRISARVAQATLDAGAAAVASAAEWRVPTLLLYAGDDHFVDPAGSDAFAASAPREVVEAERFPGLYHEILNEGALAAPVFARLERWLDARFPR